MRADQNQVHLAVCRPHGQQAYGNANGRLKIILDAVPVPIGLALDQGVDEIEDETGGKQTEKPLPALKEDD